jgi:lysine-specific demethylase 8
VADAPACLRHCDEALLARCRAAAAPDDADGARAALRGALTALVAAAAAAAPEPAPPPAALPPAAFALPSVLPPPPPPRATSSAPPAATPVPSVSYDTLTVPGFVNAWLTPGRPVLLTGLTRDWPPHARDTWHDLRALRQRHGARTVPVEVRIGTNDGDDGDADADASADAALPSASAYGAAGGGARTRLVHMPMAALIDAHLAPSVAHTWGMSVTGDVTEPASDGASPPSPLPPVVAYVSQHGLLTQLPSLAAAARVPRLVCGALRAANAWLGTAGTVTHLHTDDMQNILVQLAGFKLVRLYLPAADGGAAAAAALAAALRARAHPRAAPGALLNLFSDADAEAPAAELHARFPGLAALPPPLEVVLSPGDALFIPRGAWHYVRALTPSWSLNFWW